jgi:hypothetical protein
MNVANWFWNTFGEKLSALLMFLAHDIGIRQFGTSRRSESFSCPIRNKITLNVHNISSRFRRLWILGAFAKLRKATISFVMSVRLSVRMEQLGSHWTDFHKI